MAGATWPEATQGSAATFSRNKDLSDDQAAATTYDDTDTTYDSSTEYYDGYNPTGHSPEGEVGATWERISE